MAKPRVHELAKELDPSGKKITSKMILAWLKDQGEFVKAASSAVEPPVARRVREHFASQAASAQGGSSKPASAASAEPKPRPGKPAAPKPGGARPAAPPQGASGPAGSTASSASGSAGSAAPAPSKPSKPESQAPHPAQTRSPSRWWRGQSDSGGSEAQAGGREQERREQEQCADARPASRVRADSRSASRRAASGQQPLCLLPGHAPPRRFERAASRRSVRCRASSRRWSSAGRCRRSPSAGGSASRRASPEPGHDAGALLRRASRRPRPWRPGRPRRPSRRRPRRLRRRRWSPQWRRLRRRASRWTRWPRFHAGRFRTRRWSSSRAQVQAREAPGVRAAECAVDRRRDRSAR